MRIAPKAFSDTAMSGVRQHFLITSSNKNNLIQNNIATFKNIRQHEILPKKSVRANSCNPIQQLFKKLNLMMQDFSCSAKICGFRRLRGH